MQINSEPQIVTLNLNEIKQIDLNKDNINDIQVKLLSIVNEKASFSVCKLIGAEILSKEEIERLIRKEALFDVKISLLEKFKKVFPGEEISAEIQIFNVNNIGKVDIVLDYWLSSENGTILSSASDSLAVEAVASFVRSLIVPEDIKPGTYYFNVDVTYKEFTTSSKAEFKVKTKKRDFIEKHFKKIIIIISLIIILLLIYLIGKRNKEKGRIKKIKVTKKSLFPKKNSIIKILNKKGEKHGS